MTSTSDVSRRNFLRMGLIVPASLVVAVVGSQSLGAFVRARSSFAQDLPLTPACGEDAQPTVAQTEGPYFTRNSPERRSLWEEGTTGTRLVVSGYVLSRQCEPIPGALLDFWQADDRGSYDNRGYTLRGHQYTDETGRYELETIMPGLYPGRTRHIHVKVQAPNGPVLTTQLYFPDEPGNQRDGIYSPALVMAMQTADDARWGSFNFVVNAG